MVKMMERIEKVIERKKGEVIIRGNKDERKLKREKYENWRI